MMRIQLDLDDAGVELLEHLKRATGLKTHKELFNTAITLLEWAVNQRQQGRLIASMDEENKNYREVLIPALEYAAKQARTRETIAAG
jgi:hypothetical protein